MVVKEMHEKHGFTIKEACRYMGISYQTYNRYKNGELTPKKAKDRMILDMITKLDSRYNGLYGYRMMTEAIFMEFHYDVPEGSIQRLMSAYCFYSRYHAKCHSTYVKYDRPEVVENILGQKFEAHRPLEKLLSDVTEFHVNGKTYYLCIVLDLYCNYPLAYAISEHNDTDLVLAALSQVKFSKHFATLFHSDRGSNYTAQVVQEYLKARGVTTSMSRPGTPHDNATIESFNGLFKETLDILFGKAHSEKELVKFIDQTMYFFRYKRPAPRFDDRRPRIEIYQKALKIMKEAEKDPSRLDDIKFYPIKRYGAYRKWWEKQQEKQKEIERKDVEAYQKEYGLMDALHQRRLEEEQRNQKSGSSK